MTTIYTLFFINDLLNRNFNEALAKKMLKLINNEFIKIYNEIFNDKFND